MSSEVTPMLESPGLALENSNQNENGVLGRVRKLASRVNDLYTLAGVKYYCLTNNVSEAVDDVSDSVAQDWTEARQGGHLSTGLKSARAVGAVGMFGANFVQVRALAIPLELEASRMATPVAGGVISAGIHIGWYWLYAHSLRLGAESLPNTMSVVGERIKADKLDFPGLKPGSTQAPEHITHPAKRRLENFKLRSERAAFMQGSSTLAYVVGAALQRQSSRDQSKLCNETAFEGSLGSFTKGAMIAGSVAMIGAMNEGAGDSVYEFGHTYHGGVLINVGIMFGVMGFYKARKTWQARSARRGRELQVVSNPESRHPIFDHHHIEPPTDQPLSHAAAA